MRFIDLIEKKKLGQSHTKEEIQYIIKAVTSGSIPDYQISAWLMAVYFKGMSLDENAWLTEAMAFSGETIDLSDIGNVVVDKHSTGGVGDKVTLVLIPLLAAAGIPVAKLSGKGLGHTGGTIDKLESIQGFKTDLSMEKFISQIKSIGAAIASQTANLTPADGKLYALRDVTSTIDSMPLIASSVVSKKIASGANIIVLDVKFGKGAFVKTYPEAEELSKIMVEIGKRLNRKIVAVITSMEQPLGQAIGNAVEVFESIDTLQNKGPKDLEELTLYLGAISMVEANKADTVEEAQAILKKHLEDGSAYKKFEEIVIAQGGTDNSLMNIPTANQIIEVKVDIQGYVSELDALAVAKACKILGAGREKKEDNIDYSVGVVLNKKIGDKVNAGDVLAYIHSNTPDLNEEVVLKIARAYSITETKPDPFTLVYNTIK